jgi:hypothetical protein
VPFFDRGLQALSFAYVKDLANVCVECLSHPATAGRIYNVAGDDVVTARTLAEMIAGLMKTWTMPLPLPGALLWPVCVGQDLLSRLKGRPNVLSRQKYLELRASGLGLRYHPFAPGDRNPVPYALACRAGRNARLVSPRRMAVKPCSRWNHYRLVDWLTQGYLAIVGLLVLILHGASLPQWLWFVLAHLVLLVAIDGLIRWHAARPDRQLVDFLRHLYPVLLYAFLYRETGSLSRCRNDPRHLPAGTYRCLVDYRA